jgi:tRNA nucleotidyltransferase (CCA-adding enzyme)
MPVVDMDLLARLRVQPGGERLLATAPTGAFLVGGAVRDLLLGRTPRELDVVLEGDALAFAQALGAPVEHPRFGTASVVLEDARIDVAAARAESYPAPGALPEVEPTTLAQDLRRRDFTINAIAVSLSGPDAGELRAVPHALEDLAERRLRVLHERSFTDDPTRLLRLARYRARLDFDVDASTARLAATAVAARALDTVSGARLGAELRLALAEESPLAALVALEELDLLRALHPRLRLDRRVVDEALRLLPEDGRGDLLLMAALTLPLTLRADGDPAGESRALLDRLEFPAGDRDRVLAAAAAAVRLAGELDGARSRSGLHALIAGAPVEGVALAGAHGNAATARHWLQDVRHVRLAIDGGDLLRAGVPEGPEIGGRLTAALRRKLDGELADGRDAELRAALEASA